VSEEAARPLGREVADAVWGVFALIRYRADWSLGFEISARGFARSFLGPALALPFYLLTAAVLARADTGSGPTAASLWGSGLTLLLDAVAFPTVMALLARPLGFASGYCPFIIVTNWASLVANALLALIAFAALFGREGYSVFATFAVALFGLSVFVTWRTARETLSRETAPVLMAVVLSVGVGVVCDKAVSLAIGLG
jgi:hypothetical protein